MSPSQPSTSRPSTSQPSASHRLQTTGASRAAILDALRRADGPLTVQELADSLSLHGNTVRFHLARLAKDGRVREERVGPSGPGRPKLAYTAVEEQPAPATKAVAQHDSYQLLAQILAGYLASISDHPSQDAVAAGLEWGRHLTERPAPFSSISAEQAFDKVTTIMDTLGFETERGEGELPMLQVHHCPFRTVASQRPDVACSVHLGLMRGALAEMGAPLLATELKVSHSAAPCLALFRSTGPDGAGGTAVKQAARPEIGNPETVKPPAGE